ncbi:MAG TPA: hypothetical protein PK970_08035 [Hyphomicrobiaceae bacterium]|nr:hypothetical protein [Hyphomicrobiaceae bacterium]
MIVLRKYLLECWRKARELRQRQKANIALFSAIIAYPIMMFAGGKLELTEKGVIWLAAWLSLSAFIYLFVAAPFLLWSELQDKLTTKSAEPAELRAQLLRYEAENLTTLWEAVSKMQSAVKVRSVGAIRGERNSDDIRYFDARQRALQCQEALGVGHPVYSISCDAVHKCDMLLYEKQNFRDTRQAIDEMHVATEELRAAIFKNCTT